MELIRQYVSESSSDNNTDEEFSGYGDDTIEKYPDSRNRLLQVPMQGLLSDHGEEDEEGSDSSSGSFFASSRQKRSKRTKKEKASQKLAKKRKLAHPVQQADCGCHRKCSGSVSKDDRLMINQMFWALPKTEQYQYIRERVQQIIVKKRSRDSFTKEQPRKQHSYKFILQIGSDNRVDVCRKFFLNTLGYGEHAGNIIYRCLQSDYEGLPKSKMQEKYHRSTTKRDAVKAHILKFNPTISHYRREHAPNRLYLPSDLTEKLMYDNFKETSSINVSYALYCGVLRSMNISLVKLGHEQCESCIAAEHHSKVTGHSLTELSMVCTICNGHSNHLRLAQAARTEYRKDGESDSARRIVLAVDLQKVIQLPRLEGLKTVVFSQRLLAYNETFAPVGKHAGIYPVIACIWEESNAGRSASEIMSCFHRVILRFADMQEITLWLDNCASQNKNWNLFLFLTILTNSKSIQVKVLTLKFFESGHMYMAADSYHAAVEKRMRHGHATVTFQDFKLVIATVKKSVEVMDMEPSDFFESTIMASQYTINKCKPRPYLENIRQIKFEKGSFAFTYSSKVDDDGTTLNSCTLFSKKQLKLIGEEDFSIERIRKHHNGPRGIEPERKTALLHTILPVIAEEKRGFWEALPIKKTP